MEASVVDTLVYQLEDGDAHVRYETLQKLRMVAAVERSHFPVRNQRRFLHCLRRRLVGNAPHNALEALRLVSDIMCILGDDVEEILASILPHLIGNLPCEERNSGEEEEADGDTDGHSHQPVTLHEETYQVFRKYVIVSNDLMAVVELLINVGLAHAHTSVREACVLAIMRLLDERYYIHSRNKARSSNKASKNHMDKSLFIALFQALVPILEDPNGSVVVAAEEALGKVHLYCSGDTITATCAARIAGKWDAAFPAQNEQHKLHYEYEDLDRDRQVVERSLGAAHVGLTMLTNSVRDNAASSGTSSSASGSPCDNWTGTTSSTNAKASGSLSERSYLMDQIHPLDEDQSGGNSATNRVDSAAMADKLAMLKKKTSQLRKSASTKQVPAINAYAGENGDDGEQHSVRIRSGMSNQQVVRSHTSPQRYNEDETAERSTDRKPHSKEDVIAARSSKSSFMGFQQRVSTPEESSQPSPQKLQILQGSSHDDFAEAHKDVVLKTSLTRSYDDRPIRSQVAKTQPGSEYPDEYYASPTLNGNNDVEASMPRKVAVPSLATRKRLEAKQRQLEKEAVKEEEIQDSGTPWIQEEASGDAEMSASTASRSISLATRKRVEANAKQELNAAANQSVDDNYDDEKIGLTRKSSFVSKPVESGNSDDKSSRPSAFGNKEPQYLEPHEIKPLANPKQDVGKLLSQLRSDDWEMNFDALNIVRRLGMHHPTFLEDRIHAVAKEILVQVPNLRSTVSKNSLLALDSMFSTFQRVMDPEVDTILSVLIKRCADSNAFVCESTTSSINSVILHCSASKVMNAMAMHLSSKAIPIRREVARSMHTLIVSMADQIQSSKDLTTILGIVGNCLEDSNNEVRDAAKQSILYLCYEQRIDAEKLKKMVPQSAKAKADQVLGGKAKYTPATTTSAGSKVGGATATLTSISSTTQVAKANAAATASSSSSFGVTAATNAMIRKPPAAVITVDTTVLEALQKKLESSNWKDRYDALTDTTSFVCTHAKALSKSGKTIGFFDGVTKRMEDGNSKVNVHVLECLEKMIPALGNGMELVLSSFAPALAENLAANNPKLTTLAHSVIQVLCTHVEAKLLCQHFAVLAHHANSRVKPLLIDILDQLAAQNDDKNQFALNRYVLPLALELLKEAKSDVKDANVRLLRSLYANLEATTLQSVYRQSTAQQEKITSILGISNFAKQQRNNVHLAWMSSSIETSK